MTAPVSIHCPTCRAAGEIDEQDGSLLLSEGFSFDAIKVPVCEVCCVPAGVELGDFRFAEPAPLSGARALRSRPFG